MSDRHAEEIVLGAALVRGLTVPVDAIALRTHRDIAAGLEAAELDCDLVERVERVAAAITAVGRWDTGMTGHVSWSDLSRCVLAFDSAGDDALDAAVEHVQDSHRRRAIAAVGLHLAESMAKGLDIGAALRRARRDLSKVSP